MLTARDLQGLCGRPLSKTPACHKPCSPVLFSPVPKGSRQLSLKCSAEPPQEDGYSSTNNSSSEASWWSRLMSNPPPPPPPPPPMLPDHNHWGRKAPPFQPPQDPWAGSSGQQQQPSEGQPTLTKGLMDMGNKWKWPDVPGGKAAGSNVSSRMVKRLYKNERLQSLVRQEQDSKRNRDPWATPSADPTGVPPPPPPPGQQQPWGAQAMGRAAVDQNRGRPRQQGPLPDEMPKPPGFFSSKAESQQFMEWMTAKRAARMQQLEKSQDNEIAGIALVYLAIALLVISLSLYNAAPL